MQWSNNSLRFGQILSRRKPDAAAVVKGSPKYAQVHGTVKFYQLREGVLVAAEVMGLPRQSGPCPGEVFGFHIHEGNACTGDARHPFSATGNHFNPGSCPHPQHAGDLPPLFGNNGYAWAALLTDRFTVDAIAGRTVVIHRRPDDFTTQPAGNSGEKIACGAVKKL